MDRDRNPLVGTTVSDAIVSARIRASGPRHHAQIELNSVIDQVEQAWCPYAFGREDSTLAGAVGSLLRKSRKTLSTAESCTGGWLGKAIVDLPGSSDFYIGGWVTYSNRMKSSCLNVPARVIEQHGAVSAPVAEAMAAGALHAAQADFALAITGIAGPDGGTPTKPVGTVVIAIARHGNAAPRFLGLVRHFEFPGDRTSVRDRSVKTALQMLRFELLDIPRDTPMLWQTVPSSIDRVPRPIQTAPLA
jgi:PncC family amidohydrolase